MVAPSFVNTNEAPRRIERKQSLCSACTMIRSILCKTTTGCAVLVLCAMAFTVNEMSFKSWNSSNKGSSGTTIEQSSSSSSSITTAVEDGSGYEHHVYGKKSLGNQLGKCRGDDTPHRWSKRDFPTSDAPSLFNCDLDDARCTYYFPADFFDPNCGIGKEYVHFIEDAKAMKNNNTLWNFMPSVGFPTLTLKNTCFKSNTRKKKNRKAQTIEKAIVTTKKRSSREDMDTLVHIGQHNKTSPIGIEYRCLTERLSFLHVHKSGGSSLHNAFNGASRGANATIVRHKFWQPPAGPGTSLPRGPSKANSISSTTEEFTLDSLHHATKYPQTEFGPAQHVIFAIVRDPTERFISSIGQATGGVGSGGNHIGPILKKACLKETSALTLNCMANYVKDHGFWIELHFTPQVIDISFTTMWQDVPLSIFSFTHLKTVLGYFENHSQMRNGAAEKYRSNDVLKNMTVADYDEDTLRIVCEIYEMDVIMQRSLGLEVPRCDPFIPRR